MQLAFESVVPGDPVVVELRGGTPTTLWRGTRASIASVPRITLGSDGAAGASAGGVVALLGVGMLALHWRIRRRLRALSPPDHSLANLPRWIALAVRWKAGRYEAAVGSRTLTAQCGYRKHGLGPIALEPNPSTVRRTCLGLGLSEPKARRFGVSRGERGEGALRKPP